ncbi:molybdate ABC transporter substrate-binding protein [Paenibacillus marinisediminis]
MLTLLVTACGSKQSLGNEISAVNSSTAAEQEQVELLVSAAASLKDVLQEIKGVYETNNRDIKLNFNYGGSGALQQQIEQGAPVDLFISAASSHMQALVDKGLVDAAQQSNLLANELVVVKPAGSSVNISNLSDLTLDQVHKIAIGIPESVPAGSYAKEALSTDKLWDSLQSKMVQAKDVRQVLQYVETGNVEAGFVYKTDALASDKVEIALTVDASAYSPIVYPVGIVKATKHPKEVEKLYSFLRSEEAMNIFIKYGFSAVPNT